MKKAFLFGGLRGADGDAVVCKKERLHGFSHRQNRTNSP